MLNCRRASKLQSQARDCPLSFVDKLWLKVHLLLCGACRRFGIQLDILGKLISQVESCDAEDNDKLSPAERENLKQRVRDAQSKNGKH